MPLDSATAAGESQPRELKDTSWERPKRIHKAMDDIKRVRHLYYKESTKPQTKLAGHDRCPRKRTRPCRSRVARSNRGNPWKTNSQYSTKKRKQRSQTSRAELCKVQAVGYDPSLQGREVAWVKIPTQNKARAEKKKGKAKAKQSETTRVRGRILSDPPRQLKAYDSTQAMVIRIPASMPGATIFASWRSHVGLFEATYREGRLRIGL